MRTRWFAFCLVGLCWVQFARADTIVLKSGERVEGQITEETPTDVSIRRAFKTGNIKFVDKISRVDIARVERSAGQPATEPEAAEAPAAASSPSTKPAEPEMSTGKIADKPAFLEGALKKLQKPDYNAAGLDLSRLIVSSTPGELQQLSATVEDKLAMSLLELAAKTHFEAAMEKAKGRAVQFQYVTELEKPVLIPMIKEAYEKAIEAVVVVPGGDEEKSARPAAKRGPSATAHDDKDGGKDSTQEAKSDDRGGKERERGRPSRRTTDSRRHPRDAQAPSAHDERETDKETNAAKHEEGEKKDEPTSRPAMSIKSWMSHPEDFDGGPRECAAMRVQLAHAKSLLSERRRLDPQLRTDLDLKAELAAEQNRLEVLLKAVKARDRGARTPKEQEALEAEARNRFDAMRREEWRRQNETWLNLQRIIEDQQRLNQPFPGKDAPARGQNPAPTPAPKNQ